jgi:mannose-6-phosphate isomerase-like protein (cupin superfamily)
MPLTENQSTYSPLGTIYRLENAGKLPAVVIAVQTAACGGAEDITRYGGKYCRTTVV